MRNPFAIREDPNHPVPKEAYGWRVYLCAASAAMASAAFGYDSAFIGSTLTLPSFITRFGMEDDSVATALSANIVACFQAGSFAGSLMGYPVSEKFGRKVNLIVAGLVFIIGSVMQTASSGQIGLMYGGRVLTGIGIGASAMVVPIYIAESAPHTIRGRLIGVFEVALQIASVFGFWINYGVERNLPSNDMQWRIPFAVQIIPGGLLVSLMAFMIESPRWLVKKGRMEQALKNLCWVRNLPADHPYVQMEMEEMRTQVEHEFEAGNTWGAQWKEITAKGMRNRVIVACGMKWMQNFSGVNALNYYSVQIFTSIGFSGGSTGLLATGVYGLVKAVATLIFINWCVDNWGRRPALLWGSCISLIAMYYLGGYSKVSGSFDDTAPRDGGAYVAIIMVYVYAAAYAISWNAIPWILAAEIFPTKIRGLGMLLTVANQWISQFVIVYTVPYMIANIKYGIFLLFGSCILVSGVIVWFFVPETKGFKLEEMDLIWTGPIWAREARKLAEEERERAVLEQNTQTAGKQDDQVISETHYIERV